MRKLCLIFFCCVFCVVTDANAQTWKCGKNGNNVIATLKDGILTISGTGEMMSFGHYGDYPWHRNRTRIKKLNIQQGVTSIGHNAFKECTVLNSVTIPASVTSIGRNAFRGCITLTSVTIPEGVTSIGEDAFRDCSLIVTVQFNAINCTSVSYDESSVFYGCTALTSLNIGNNVTKIPNYVFRNCRNLTSVTIPNSVTSIGKGAFSICYALTSVSIPESVTDIGVGAFSYCTNLASVTIPSSVTSIGDKAFFNCEALTSVIIPESVTFIGYDAFNNCAQLAMVQFNAVNCKIKPNIRSFSSSSVFSGCTAPALLNIGKNVIQIPESAFVKWQGLTSVNISNGVTSIGEKAFSDCTALTSVTIPSSVTSIGDYAFSNSGLTSVTIPNNVTYLGFNSFSNCRQLATVQFNAEKYDIGYNRNILDRTYRAVFSGCTTKLNIGSSVTSIWYEFFTGAEFTSIEVAADNANYSSINGVLFNKKKTTLLQYPNGKMETSYIIPNGVTEISWYAFSNCRTLASVTIPNGVTSIGIEAFSNCTNLTSITIPASVRVIENGAFSNCHQLEMVQFNAVDCWRMSNEYSFRIPPRQPVFWGCEALTTLNIGNNVTRIPDYAFWGCSNLTSVTIGNKVTSIGDEAFANCTGLTSVIMPSSVTDVSNSAFWGCTGLTSATIPEIIKKMKNEKSLLLDGWYVEVYRAALFGNYVMLNFNFRDKYNERDMNACVSVEADGKRIYPIRQEGDIYIFNVKDVNWLEIYSIHPGKDWVPLSRQITLSNLTFHRLEN
jgi:hypothetical protein